MLQLVLSLSKGPLAFESWAPVLRLLRFFAAIPDSRAPMPRFSAPFARLTLDSREGAKIPQLRQWENLPFTNGNDCAMPESMSQQLIASARRLADAVDQLRFAEPVAYVYNPLRYAWGPHESYLRRFGSSRKKLVFLGMNPGPFGMAQTGAPFGEVAHARDWMGLEGPVGQPPATHPKRPVEGFACARSEVSGRRLWGAFKERFGAAEAFFADHFVANYCPLLFLEESGRNRAPDKMSASEVAPLYAACDRSLRELVEILKPEWLIGVGAFAEGRAREALAGMEIRVGRILHPSPASPAANRGWAEQATRQMREMGIW